MPLASTTRLRARVTAGRSSALAWVRDHVLFCWIAAAGVLLRLLCEVAYYPALRFPDGDNYLANARTLVPGIWHPLGYPLFLLVLGRSVPLVTLVQHGIGIATAVLLVVLLEHTGVSRRMAALASAPVLLDPMQVYLEQFVLSDVLFTFLVVAAVFLCFKRRLTVLTAAGVGLLVAYATIVRTLALVVAVPLALVWVWRRVGWRQAGVALAVVAVPLSVYAAAFDHEHGRFAMQGLTGRWLYGRAAPFADCGRLTLPDSQKPLCPTQPRAIRIGPNQFVWDRTLPFFAAGLPADPLARSELAGKWAQKVILHQPLDFVGAVTHDVASGLAPGRSSDPRQWFVGSWQFYRQHQPPYWRVIPPHQYVVSPVSRAIGSALSTYERYVFVPGPIGLLALGFAVAGVVYGARRGKAVALVLATVGLLFLVVPIVTVDLDFRYVLPALELLVAAGAVGAHLLRLRLAEQGAPTWVVSNRARTGLLATIAAGAAVCNVAVPQGYAASAFTPPTAAAIGPAHVGSSLLVDISAPVAVGDLCTRVGSARAGRRRVGHVFWIASTSVRVSLLRRDSLLLAMDNFYVEQRHRIYEAGNVIPPSDPLVTRVLSPSHPQADGIVDFVTPTATGRLVYVDPIGHGAADWSYDIPAPGNLPPTGARCTRLGYFLLDAAGRLRPAERAAIVTTAQGRRVSRRASKPL